MTKLTNELVSLDQAIEMLRRTPKGKCPRCNDDWIIHDCPGDTSGENVKPPSEDWGKDSFKDRFVVRGRLKDDNPIAIWNWIEKQISKAYNKGKKAYADPKKEGYVILHKAEVMDIKAEAYEAGWASRKDNEGRNPKDL